MPCNRFEQLPLIKSTFNDVFVGTGFGIASVRTRVAAMRGRVLYDADANSTRFTVLLPQGADGDRDVSAATADEPAREDQHAGGA